MYLIKNGLIITLNKKEEIIKGDLLIENKYIKKIASKISSKQFPSAKIINAENNLVLPGFIQMHTHLAQVLFRGYADDLTLIKWLKTRIWPMESAHTPQSLFISSCLGLIEMQMSGTTTIFDIGSVKHISQIFNAAEKSKIRFFGGKCLMDIKKFSGPLYQSYHQNIQEMESSLKKWHKKNDLINYILNPRFAVSCSEKLLLNLIKISKQNDLFLHTHASETKEEISIVKKRTGKKDIEYLNSINFLSPKTIIVHGIHLNNNELNHLINNSTSLCHCPSANLKLASGIAPIEKYRKKGLNICLGTDGAACNNTMDPLWELRLAALLQKPLFGPSALPAKEALKMLTINGAKALKMDKKIGSLEEGKFADLILISLENVRNACIDNPYSALVYSTYANDVKYVFINGKMIVKNSQHQIFDTKTTILSAKKHLKKILSQI